MSGCRAWTARDRRGAHRLIRCEERSNAVVVDIDVHDPEGYEEYKRLAPPAVAACGGRYLVRGGKLEVLEGEWAPSRLVILEFPGLIV